MKRVLLLTLAALFLYMGIAGATDFTLTGTYYARGTWVDNWDGKGRDNDPVTGAKNQYGVYDHEMSLDANWQISPATKVFARFEIRDENWGVDTNPTESLNAGETDDNIAVEHVWGQHTFMDNKTTVKAGLMGTNAWATPFSNQGNDAYRVLVTKMTDVGLLIAYTEKEQRVEYDGTLVGRSATESIHWERGASDDDADTYAVAMVTKVGDVKLLPLLKYVDMEFNDLQVFLVDFGATGSFGNIGFEAEFIYVDYNYDNEVIALDRRDYSTHGAYVNVWTQLNEFKIGALVAYGSYDEDVDKGFEFGDDFSGGGAMILGDELFMYDNGASATAGLAGELSYDDLQAVTLLAAYASYDVSEKLTLSAYFGYADSNVKSPPAAALQGKYDGATAWEINVQGAYKLSRNVTYSAGAATAQLEYGDNTPDPDKAVEIYHKLSFSF